MNLNDLPPEMLSHVCAMCTHSDLASLSCVSFTQSPPIDHWWTWKLITMPILHMVMLFHTSCLVGDPIRSRSFSRNARLVSLLSSDQLPSQSSQCDKNSYVVLYVPRVPLCERRIYLFQRLPYEERILAIASFIGTLHNIFQVCSHVEDYIFEYSLFAFVIIYLKLSGNTDFCIFMWPWTISENLLGRPGYSDHMRGNGGAKGLKAF